MADDIDWSKLNQPFGTLEPTNYTPTQRLGNAAQDVLESAGAQPHVARHLVEGAGNILGATPLGVPGAAANLIDAKAKGNIGQQLQAALGLFPATRALKANVFPVMESERERIFRTGFDHFARVDAGALKQQLEKSLRQPLAWSEDKMKALRESGVADAYPRLSVEKGRVGIHDGRHRIATAAERGQAIDVVTETPQEAEHLEKMFPMPNARARGGRAFAKGGTPAPVDDWITPPEADDWVTPEEPKEKPDIGGPLFPFGQGQFSAGVPAVNKAVDALSEAYAKPVRQYLAHNQHMNEEARNQVGRGVDQLTSPQSMLDPVWGAGNVAFGSLGYLGSPVNAAYRTVLGQPVEDITGIPKEYTEFAAQLATPGLGMTKLPRRPGVAPEAPPMRAPISAKADRAAELGDEFGLKYSKGQAEGDLDAIRFEDMAARNAYGKEAQGEAAPFFDKQFEDIQNAGRNVGQKLSRSEQPLNSPADAGSSLNTMVADRAAEARAESERLAQIAQQEEAAHRARVEQSGINIGERIAGGRPQVDNPREAGEIAGQGVRDAAAEDKAHYQASYENVAREKGEFAPGTFEGVGSRIKNDLHFHEESPVDINELTPAASHAIKALDEWSTPKITNLADPRAKFADPQMAVTLKNVDTFMKRLSGFYGSAATKTDQRAVGRIMTEFGNQVERAISDGLFSGDPRALDMLNDAKASFKRYQQTYKPREAGDDVGTAMRRIVERNATPEETANMIIGSGKLGQAGLPVRIAGRLQNVLGADSDAWNAIRQAMWQKASRIMNKAGEIDHVKSAQSIDDFANSTLGRRMFAPDELTAMRNHARGARDLESVIENLPSRQAASQASENFQRIFGGQDLTGSQRAVFQRMTEGRATPEETANAFFSVIAAGNPGHAVRALKAIEQIAGKDSPIMGTIREGVWQKLTSHPFGKDQPGQQKLVQSVHEFLNGDGRSLAKQLYTDEERKLMGRYAEAVKTTIIPKYARTNSDTAPALLGSKALRKTATTIATAIGVMLHGGVGGGLEGYGVGKLIDKAADKVGTARTVRKVKQSLANEPPPTPEPPSPNAALMRRSPIMVQEPSQQEQHAQGGIVARRVRTQASRPRTTAMPKDPSPFQQRTANPFTT